MAIIRRLMALLIVGALLLTGCGSSETPTGDSNTPGESATPKPALTVNPTESVSIQPTETEEKIDYETTGNLTVFIYIPRYPGGSYEDRPIYTSAQAYMKIHPNVQIDFITTDDYSTYENICKNGGTADIIGFPEWWTAGIYYDWCLADLNELIRGDGSFRQEDYYMDIINAFQVKGELPVLCTSFQFENIYSVRTDLSENLLNSFEKNDQMDFFDLIRLYRQYQAVDMGDNIDDTIFFSRYYTQIYPFQYVDSALDLDNKTANFYHPDFIELLEETRLIKPSKRWIFADEDGLRRGISSTIPAPPEKSFLYQQILEGDKNEVFRNVFQDTNSTLALLPYKNMHYTMPKHVSTDEGNYVFSPKALYGIVDTSTEKDLAWDFFKFMIAEVNIPDDKWAYSKLEECAGVNPVNINNFERYTRAKLNFEYDDVLAKLKKTPEGEMEEIIEKATTLLVEFASQLNMNDAKTNIATEFAWPALYKFLQGETTIDYAAKAIQLKIEERFGYMK